MVSGNNCSNETNGISLGCVIYKIKEMADSDYEGNVNDNILTIFNRLSTKEKRLLLRGWISIFFLVDATVSVKHVLPMLDNETKASIEGERRNIDEFNEIELIKLKSWLAKMGMFGIALGLFVMLGVTMLFSGNDIEIFKSFGKLWNVVVTMFGL